ncbi:MAG TPA: hypothetical protein VKU36_00165 [Candidatus Babeliales bacterium]|nr:hypothetical protein [Candidatus Babeliales bacterium]
MKKFILIITLIPSLSWAMETAKPTITIKAKDFNTLLQKHHSTHSSYDNFCHHIKIPTQGAFFTLQMEGFFPLVKNLTIDSGTKFITISGERSNFFAIYNDSGTQIAQLVKLEKKKKNSET